MIFNTLEKICSFYEDTLYTPEASTALGYLRSRGFTDETLKKFSIGFAPKDHVDYVGASILTYSDVDRLLEVSHLRKNGAITDRFAGRIIFPYKDELGRVRGFGGRTLGNDVKYVVSSEGPVFQKRNLVYGIDLARSSMFDKNSAILCEGFTDVMAFHQLNITHAVGCIGTSITQGHLLNIHKYAKEVYLCLDGDTAGQSAANTSLSLLQKMGFAVKVINLENGKDPADMLLA